MYLMKMNLQLFADGGDGGAPAAAAEAAGTQAGEAKAQVAAGEKARKGNPLANIRYGIQESQEAEAAAAQEETPSNSADNPIADKNAEFEKLIKGEFKEQYDARVQSTLEKRFKSQDAVIERQKQLDPILQILAEKYGVDTKDGVDIEKLTKAIYEDDSYYEQEAMEKGIPVAVLKDIKRMERENAQIRQAMEERQRQDRNQQAYQELLRQSDETKKVYPGFELKKEMENPQFQRLIAAGVDARAAYEVIHREEIQPAMAQYVAERTAQRIANDIQSGARRPTENGASPNSATVSKTDVSKLTKEDRMEIMRRVAAGEKIRF